MKRKTERKERYEWLVVQRLKKTGNPVRTISLDPETDAFLSQQSNASEFVREAIREKMGRQVGLIALTPAEDDVYSAIQTFYSQPAQRHIHERFPEDVSDELSTQMLNFVHEHISSRLDSEEWDSPIYALKVVEKAREEKEFWLELYKRIRITYVRDMKRPRGTFGEPL